jgi:hypothetical protein
VNLGTENRTKVIAAAVLGFAALILFVRFFLADSSPAASSAPPTAPSATTGQRTVARRTTGAKGSRPAVAPSLDPTLRLDLLKESEETKYSGSARNIFTAAAEPIPVPKTNGTTDQKAAYTPPPVAPPPPILLKFFGFASKPGEPKRIFLSQGDDVFIASEGDIIDRRYRVLRISATSVEVEDVLNNNRQSIPLTQG